MAETAPSYPDTAFAVISDLHVYDHSLGCSGAAFEQVLHSDRKYLLESLELLDCAIDTIIAARASFVLIPGDLTKDGELVNHNLLAQKLARFTDAGIAVYVAPGNHDIKNPHARNYSGGTAAPVPSVSAADFQNIYRNFGFAAAAARDSASLSYAARPAKGLLLLSLDSCCYQEQNGSHPLVYGKIAKETQHWLAALLEQAASEGEAVIAMMHHGLVEHWPGQARLHPDFLLRRYRAFGEFLASWNVRLAFTGHYHAQNAALARFGGKFVCDIETGSLVSSPCPVRFLEIKNNTLSARTVSVLDKIRPGSDFAAKAGAFTEKVLNMQIDKKLRRLKLPEKDRLYIARAVTEAFTAHIQGDADNACRPVFDSTKLGLWGRFVWRRQRYILDGLWTKSPPADNDFTLDLSHGC